MCVFPLPANEPPPFMLVLCYDSEAIPATRTRQVKPMVPGESDYKDAIQEAHKHYMLQMDNHKWVLQQDQRIAARKPNELQIICHGGTRKVWWHVAEILFERASLGPKSLVSMSFHFSNMYAKRPVVGPKRATSHR